METSFVTVWVLVAFLVYEYFVLFSGANIATLAAAAGVLAPIGGAVVGLIPGCGPQILLSSVYAEGGLPFRHCQPMRSPRTATPCSRYWPSTPGPPSSPRFTTSCPPSSSASRSTSCGAPCSGWRSSGSACCDRLRVAATHRHALYYSRPRDQYAVARADGWLSASEDSR